MNTQLRCQFRLRQAENPSCIANVRHENQDNRMRIRIQEEICEPEYGFGPSKRMRIRMADGTHVKYPTLLANLHRLMEEKGWDQNALADHVRASQGSVSRWGGQSIPRGDTLARLADLAGVAPTDFVERPLSQGRRVVRALPNGQELVEAMEALLDSAGLPHLVDEYAPKLALLLPGILEGSSVPREQPGSTSKPLRGGEVQARAKGDPGKPR